MTLARPPRPLHLRRIILGGALLYFVLVGGTNFGAFVPEARMINALIGAVLVALWLWDLPGRHDLVDRLVLLALILFLVACVTSLFPRMSFDAAVNALAFAAAFGVARTELASEGARRWLTLALAASGFVVSLLLLSWWAPQWLAWIDETGQAPPFDLLLPAGIYRHHYYAAMLVTLLLPALVATLARPRLRLAAAVGVLASLAVIVMAGSRTIWLAVLVVAVALILIRARAYPRRLLWLGAVGAVGVVAIAISGSAGQLLARIGDLPTLGSRLAIWSTALERWAARPLVGDGPGSFGSAVTLGGFFDLYREVPLNAHNAIVQQLQETGIVGLVAMGILVASALIGLRTRPVSVPAVAALALFGLMCMTDNPSARPNLAVLAIVWAGYALPRGEVVKPAGVRARRSIVPALGTAAAAVIVAVVVLRTLAAAGAFEQARTALQRDDLEAARSALDTAVELDPGMALYVRERGVRAAEAGQTTPAIADIEKAAQLNPADATAHRALAVLRAGAGQPESGLASARVAFSLGREQAENGLTLAYVAGVAGEDAVRTEALVDALAANPYLAAAAGWPELFPVEGDLQELLVAAHPVRLATLEARGRSEYPEAWLPAATANPALVQAGPGLLAIDSVIRCELGEAGEILEAAPSREARGVAGLTAQILLARLTGDTAAVQQAILLARLWRLPLAGWADDLQGPASPFSDFAEDVRLYERNPLPSADMPPILPTSEEGIAIWLQDPKGAAERSAPASGLARCRPEEAD